MQKVSFSFPPELVTAIDAARGEASRNQFVRGLLSRSLTEHRERQLQRCVEEVYSDAEFAKAEEDVAEELFQVAPDAEI